MCQNIFEIAFLM